MPRPKKTATKDSEPQKEGKTPDIAGALSQLASAIRQLEKRMTDGFAELKQSSQSSTIPYPGEQFKTDTTTDNKKEEEPVNQEVVETPFPVEWRAVIDEVLNKKFKAEVKYLADGVNFEVTIYVPKEYSNATQQEWDMYKNDRRIKVIPTYQNIQGVRLFAEDIAKQLGDERRIKINDDRAKLINA